MTNDHSTGGCNEAALSSRVKTGTFETQKGGTHAQQRVLLTARTGQVAGASVRAPTDEEYGEAFKTVSGVTAPTPRKLELVERA